VSYSAANQENEHQARIMRESVERIEWALREVLPGKNDAPPQQVPGRPWRNPA